MIKDISIIILAGLVIAGLIYWAPSSKLEATEVSEDAEVPVSGNSLKASEDQSKQTPKYGLISILAPFASILVYTVIAACIGGASDTTHGFFKVFLIVEVLWYCSILGLISGFIGINNKERPAFLSYIGAAGNGILAAFLAIAILF